MKILIAGDYFPNNRIKNLVEKDDQSAISDDIRKVVQSADFSIVNYECPIDCRGEYKPIPKSGPNLRSTPKEADYIHRAGFSMATLANNHTLDYGGQAILDTRDYLEKIGMKTVGAGKNLDDAGKTVYVHLHGEKVAIINCCEHEFSIATESSPGTNPLDPVRQYYAIQEARHLADVVIVIVHGGAEHHQLPTRRMIDTYRFFIDCGAAVVVNHHQHCYSGYEIYNNGFIFYGLGNFCFDEGINNEKGWYEGYVVSLSFDDKGREFKLYPIIQCRETPVVRIMNDNETRVFHKRLSEINSIINHPETLREKNQEWMNATYKQQRNVLLPYNNRYLIRAANKGLIPKGLPKKKLCNLLNKIACESHRDRMIYFLNNEVK